MWETLTQPFIRCRGHRGPDSRSRRSHDPDLARSSASVRIQKHVVSRPTQLPRSAWTRCNDHDDFMSDVWLGRRGRADQVRHRSRAGDPARDARARPRRPQRSRPRWMALQRGCCPAGRPIRRSCSSHLRCAEPPRHPVRCGPAAHARPPSARGKPRSDVIWPEIMGHL